jgi:hypothetical protein
MLKIFRELEKEHFNISFADGSDLMKKMEKLNDESDIQELFSDYLGDACIESVTLVQDMVDQGIDFTNLRWFEIMFNYSLSIDDVKSFDLCIEHNGNVPEYTLKKGIESWWLQHMNDGDRSSALLPRKFLRESTVLELTPELSLKLYDSEETYFICEMVWNTLKPCYRQRTYLNPHPKCISFPYPCSNPYKCPTRCTDGPQGLPGPTGKLSMNGCYTISIEEAFCTHKSPKSILVENKEFILSQPTEPHDAENCKERLFPIFKFNDKWGAIANKTNQLHYGLWH